jgi:hypothetical protein
VNAELFLFVGIAIKILFLFFTHRYLHREVRPHIEGRVDVDQIYLVPELLSREAMTSLLSPQVSRFRKSSGMVVRSSPRVV